MAGETSFIANVNKVANKIDIITSANTIFDAGVLPTLEEIAALDLQDATDDLKKGTYLGNRKLDIDLSLNIQGITASNKISDPTSAEALWVANSANVTYSSATITFVDGTVVELPFLSDNNPTVITNAAGLLVQLNRTDVVNAVAQESSVYSFNVFDSTSYVVTIDNIDYTYTTGVGSTQGEIVTGLTNQINSGSEPWTAYNMTDTVKVVADIAGNSFVISVDANMQVQELTANTPAGNYPTEFLTTLTNTSFNSFTLDTINDTIRLYDVIGSSSNIERIQLHTSNTASNYATANPVYFWGQTTSALEVVAMRAGDVIKLGNEIDNIILLANKISQVLAIQDRIPELIDTYVNNVAQGDVTIYNKLDELHNIYTNLTALVGVYQDIQVGGNNYTNTVATNLTGANTIGTVATNIADVNTVATDITGVNTVSGSITNVNTVASNIGDVATVTTNIANVNTVGMNIANVNAVVADQTNIDAAVANTANINSAVGNATNINTVAGDTTAINAVAGDLPNINSVASDIVSIDSVNTTIVPNINKILLADNNATVATQQAAIATTQAGIATTKASEITSISGTQNTNTLAAGNNATSYYDAGTGKFTFGLPQGAQGAKGDSFTVNATDIIANRSVYDAQPKGFSFVALDQGNIYFKSSNISGDWSVAAPFGKGDTGNGITSIVYTSSTGTGQAQPGETDTYTINFTDASTSTFTVTNGNVATAANVGLGNVNNTSDINKPISTATQNALNTKLDGTAYTAADILAKLKTVDTDISGLNADTLDSMQPSALPISNATQTALSLKQDIVLEGAFVNGDKTKLDGIELGATADQTKADIDALGISAAQLTTARTIGGVFFDGTANVNLPGVNTAGNQSTTGNAGTATKLATARTIDITGDITATAVAFDGSANIAISAIVNDDSHNHVIGNVDGLQVALDGKQLQPSEGAFVNGDKTKLDGIAVGANNYTLPASVVHETEYATSTIGGTVKARLVGNVLYLTNNGSNA